MNILGVKIDNISREEILKKIKFFLREEKFHQIATVNPEFVLQAQKDSEFKNILNSCDLNIADGAGIWFAYLRFGKILQSRMAGADLMDEILKIAGANNYSIFLASNDKSLSAWEETRDAILKKYPNLEINGACLDAGRPIGQPMSEGIIADYGLPVAGYDIIFCSFGAPYQEKFLRSLKNQENAKIKLAMGVGGSFDFLTGKRKRAPEFLQKIGLEWLWRFLYEPTYRAKRIWRAVIIFPIRIIFNK